MSSPSLTDPGIPSYVQEGYVQRGYQQYYSSVSGAVPGTLPQQGVTPIPAPTPGAIGGGITLVWPTVPPTLPPETCPPLNSIWSAGPSETGDELGYTPPVSDPNDDGITFPVSPSDVILKQQWHGLASTLNPLNLAAINLQLAQVIHDAVTKANSTKTVSFPAVNGIATGTITSPVTPFYDIQVAVEMAVIQSMLQGTGLWYELVLKPLNVGPFSNYYVVDSTAVAIPMGIDLSA